MNYKNTAIIIGVSVLLSLLIGALLPGKTIERIVEKGNLGALAGPDIPSQYLKWGDVKIVNTYTNALTDSASTTCSFPSPTGTSTPILAGLKITSGFQGATMQVEAGKATNPYSTTTSLGIGTFPSGGQGLFIASTTNFAQLDGVSVFTSSNPDYLNFKVGTSTANIEGTCQATWIVW